MWKGVCVAEPLCCYTTPSFNQTCKVKGGGAEATARLPRGHPGARPHPLPLRPPLHPQDTGFRVLPENQVGYRRSFPAALGLGPASHQAAADPLQSPAQMSLGSSGQGHLGSSMDR